VMKSLIEKLQKRLGPGEKLVGVRFEFAEFGREQSNSFLSGIASATLLTPKQAPAVAAVKGGRGTTRRHRN
jgi:hypothetical protein